MNERDIHQHSRILDDLKILIILMYFLKITIDFQWCILSFISLEAEQRNEESWIV